MPNSSEVKLLNLGTITRIHGIKGAFVVQIASEKDSSLPFLKSIYIGSSEKSAKAYSILEASWMPSGWKVQVAEITTPEEAQKLIQSSLFAERGALPAPPEKEYYEADLVGLPAYSSETKELFGTYLYSEPVGATNHFQQDRWWFRTVSGEFSIPAVKRYIERVDIPNGKIWLKNLSDFAEVSADSSEDENE